MKNLENYLTLELNEIAKSKLSIRDVAYLKKNNLDYLNTIDDIPNCIAHLIRQELISMYFNVKKTNTILTQKQADILNIKNIKIRELLENNTTYDMYEDYLIDFDYAVPTNKNYGRIILGE